MGTLFIMIEVWFVMFVAFLVVCNIANTLLKEARQIREWWYHLAK